MAKKNKDEMEKERQETVNEDQNKETNTEEHPDASDLETRIHEVEELEDESMGECDDKDDKILRLQTEIDEWKDKYVRLAAEFDNYRKRTLNEKMEMTKTASKDVLENFLPIMDDFERAIESMNKSEDENALKEGIDLIYTKCQSFLTQNGVKPIEALHEAFDTDVHEAMTKIPVEDDTLKGKVVDVVQKGYYIHENVLRYAKVVVGE